jgi:hypothetical protein
LINRMKAVLALAICAGVASAQGMISRVDANGGWKLQFASKVQLSGEEVSSATYDPKGWYAATVPGTALTTLVNNHIYAEPTYGENDRPESIPESLARNSYWYRTTVAVPPAYRGRHTWLHFDGINYSATVWVNGAKVGTIRGAFIRGLFDITAQVKPGSKAVVAVLIDPQPHPGTPHEHTLRAGIGLNGGDTALDGPTFLSSIGWDWLATVRDRETGIWQGVYLDSTGPVLLKDPLVTTDLPLPKTDSADIGISTTVENVTDTQQTGVVHGRIEGISFEEKVELAPHSSQLVKFDSKSTPALHMLHPRLWWPAGYGAQALYDLHLEFAQGAAVSDTQRVKFGVRKIQYSVPESDNLTISVNGVRMFLRGGDWGLDEAMKRVPRERLEAQIKLHRLANINLIRNWVGQSTSEDLYELCDQYGILIWDEFFQPNPSDGPEPLDVPTYMANVRDKILRLRNHPSIMLWCARNEGDPPPVIDAGIKQLIDELEPTRLYQPSSTSGHGVMSHGPYHWQEPAKFYNVDAAFKTEIGSVSVPTLESIQGMMPQKDWETINDDWAIHDFARGNSGADTYPEMLNQRYGKVLNLADFVRKAQLANYEGYRAMYEGRNAKLFAPATAIITWMSHPAQPSFVWQLYHYDLEPNASLYGVKAAGETVHVQWNETTDQVQVINNLPTALQDARLKVTVYALDGKVLNSEQRVVNAEASKATDVLLVKPGEALQFVRLELTDAAGKPLSRNFYWRGAAGTPDNLTSLNSLSQVTLKATAVRRDALGKTTISVTLSNPTEHVALMTHVQLHHRAANATGEGDRVLPAFASENYLSLAPGETRELSIVADTKLLQGGEAVVAVDGWNVGITAAKSPGVVVELNTNAQVDHWPVTYLPYQKEALR